MDAALHARLALALSAARDAAELTLHYFRRGVTAEPKADGSPVTVADREAELALRRAIGAAFPDDAILGEEFGDHPGTSGWRWIIDPIDGTKSFLRRVPLFGTLLGVEHNEDPVIGVVAMPALAEVCYAARAERTWLIEGREAPRRVAVSRVSRLSESFFCTTSISGRSQGGRRDVLMRIADVCATGRGWSDCYGHVLVATGRADVMVDTAMKPWDAAAILPILEEAGGRFTDWQGNRTIRGGDGVSTNALVHDEVLTFTRGAPPR